MARREEDAEVACECATAVGGGSGVATVDAFARPTGAVSCGAAGLLAADRVGSDDGRGRGDCWRFMAGRIPVVPSRWRHAADQPKTAKLVGNDRLREYVQDRLADSVTVQSQLILDAVGAGLP